MSFAKDRIEELDGLRGIAVSMVVLWHFVGGTSGRASPGAEAAYAMTIWGRTGVDLFFVLSGFLIIGILADYRGARNAARVFYIRRLLRILPPYLLLVGVYWVVFVGAQGKYPYMANADGGVLLQVAAQLTFTWNWLMAAYNRGISYVFDATWSIGVEEWFYLFFPWIIFATRPKSTAAILITIAVISIVLRAVVYLAFPWADYAPYVLPPLRLDEFCYGGLLALAMRNTGALGWLESRRGSVSRLALAFAIVGPLLIALVRNSIDANMYLWGHTVFGLGFTVILNRSGFSGGCFV